MTKTFTFKTKNNNNNNNGTIFLNSNGYNTDYSKTLDNIIAADIISKNSYLFNTPSSTISDADLFTSLIDEKPIILTGSNLKADDKFIKAANFLANYKTYKKTYNIPYILGKMYKLSDGTPIIFYDDEIQIGFDTYKYTNFGNLSFLNGLATTTKNTIINIFTSGLGNIKINIL